MAAYFFSATTSSWCRRRNLCGSTELDTKYKSSNNKRTAYSCRCGYRVFFFVLSPKRYPIANVIKGVIIAQKSFIGSEISSAFNPIQQ